VPYVSKKNFYAIKNTLGYTERVLIDFYEFQWHFRHSVPTPEEVVRHINSKYEKEGKDHRTTLTSVNYYLGRRQVQKALEDRGIPWQQHSRETLTEAQIAAATLVMNFADTRSISEKLDALGVNPNQYYAWLKDPLFKNYVDTLSEENLHNIKPTAVAEFTKKINQGDWQAIKYYLDVTGAIQSSDAPNTEFLLVAFMEILQKHVKDPTILTAIAGDLKKATANRTLEVINHAEIEGTTVNQDELREAKKMIGFA
jgi:Helix-turn-helix of insertion element transposase